MTLKRKKDNNQLAADFSEGKLIPGDNGRLSTEHQRKTMDNWSFLQSKDQTSVSPEFRAFVCHSRLSLS